jgi:hypothetical protein
MSSTATAATARRITATAKAAVSASLGARFITSSQGPYSFRVVLRGVEANPSAELSAAGLAVLAIRGLDEGARFTATWGRARNRQVVITVTDETAREASIAEQGAAREAAMQKALAERPAEPGPDGGELRYDEHGARFWTAEELAAEKAQQEQTAEPELRSIGTDLYEVVRGGQAAGRVSLLGHGWYGYDLTGTIRTGCHGGPDTAAAALADAAPGITPDSPAGGDTCGECGALIVKRWHADGGGSHWGHADPALDGHPAPALTAAP